MYRNEIVARLERLEELVAAAKPKSFEVDDLVIVNDSEKRGNAPKYFVGTITDKSKVKGKMQYTVELLNGEERTYPVEVGPTLRSRTVIGLAKRKRKAQIPESKIMDYMAHEPIRGVGYDSSGDVTKGGEKVHRLARGHRVIVNYNRGSRKNNQLPEYYVGEVTSLRSGTAGVTFDDGEKYAYPAAFAPDGILGITELTRKYQKEIPEADLGKWLGEHEAFAEPRKVSLKPAARPNALIVKGLRVVINRTGYERGAKPTYYLGKVLGLRNDRAYVKLDNGYKMNLPVRFGERGIVGPVVDTHASKHYEAAIPANRLGKLLDAKYLPKGVKSAPVAKPEAKPAVTRKPKPAVTRKPKPAAKEGFAKDDRIIVAFATEDGSSVDYYLGTVTGGTARLPLVEFDDGEEAKMNSGDEFYLAKPNTRNNPAPISASNLNKYKA